MADPYQAGQALGTAIFGSTQDTYTNQLGRQYQVEQALQQARQARSKAILASQINEQRAMVNPDLVNSVLGGDQEALGTLGSIALLANDNFDAGQLGDLVGAAARSGARDAALGGNWEGANANLMAIANGPQELAKIDEQNLMQNRFALGGGGVTTTGQGLANIRRNDAAAANSYAAADNSRASAARTRQATALDRADVLGGGGGRPSSKAPSGYRWDANGGLEFIPGGPADPANKSLGAPSEGERKSATLLNRLENSLGQMNTAISENKDAASPSILGTVVGGLPFSGETAQNFVNSSERQRVEAAQLDILDAALTLGTGAAYTKEQLEGYRKSYFPRLGDSQDTVKDKQARLDNIVESARIAAGRAAPPSGLPSAPSTLGDRPAGAPVQRARNPNTGQVLVLRNGQWVPE